MADIELVIKIPEEVKNRLCFGVTFRKDIQMVCEALDNGTPLPKGHGRLIDANEVDNAIYKCFEGIQFYDGTGYDIYSDSKEDIDKIPTIIEADKTESGGKHEKS